LLEPLVAIVEAGMKGIKGVKDKHSHFHLSRPPPESIEGCQAHLLGDFCRAHGLVVVKLAQADDQVHQLLHANLLILLQGRLDSAKRHGKACWWFSANMIIDKSL
jgi:hypothetical protein